MRFFRIIVLLAIVVMPCHFVSAGTEPIVTTDLLRMRWVTAIDVAKDGQRAAFAVRSILTVSPDPNLPTVADLPTPEPTYKYQSHIFVLELADANAQPRQLTFGDRHDTQPRLSPDGKRIAFVRDAAYKPSIQQSPKPRETESNAQIWILPVDGGEARQLTAFKNGCSNPRWSPDGSRILVSSLLKLDEIEGVPSFPSERPKRQWKDATSTPAREAAKPRPDGSREQIRAWLERNAATLNPTVINRIEFHDEQQLRGSMRFNHLFLIDPDPPVPTALPIETAHARRITDGFFDHTEPAFAPDGRSIVYVAKKPVDQHPDRVLQTNIWQINIDGTNDRPLLAVNGWRLASPKFSRDGTVIVFTGEQIDEPPFRQTQLGMASLRAESPGVTWLTSETSFAGSVDQFEWLHTQPAVIFNAPQRGGFPLLTITPGIVEPAVLVGERDGQPIGVNVFGVGGGAIVYAQTTVDAPSVVRVRDGFGDRMAFNLNPWIETKALATPTVGWLTRPDGVKIQYWLMEPTNREAGKKYPLVTNMHGGPAAMWGPGEFSTWHEFQLLCSWGFGVVYCNPRGSGGYGYEFQKKNFQDWGPGPAGDVLAVVDQVVMKDGAEWIDRDRMVLTGGSYAGYLTAYIIANDHRFKAAVAQRGVYDFATFFGEANAWRLIVYAMGGTPYDPRIKQALDRNNVFNHVTKIRTPLLIKHASNDLRTGVSQSEMLYRALKEQNKPVEYIRYPDAGHDLSRGGDPVQRMDRLNRMIEFFERYVTNERPAPVGSGG